MILSGMKPELIVFIVPGIFFIIILGATMQFLRSKDLKEAGLSPAAAVTNMFLVLLSMILFVLLAMVIITKFVLVR
jgi:hypothetical protein